MNKYVLILGASSDIGVEIIRQIDNEQLVIFAHYCSNKMGLKALASEVSAELVPIQADFREEASVDTLIQEVQNKCDSLYGIVHLPAPQFTHIRFKDASWEEFQLELNIQVRSIVQVLKHFIPIMAKAKNGRVILMLTSFTLGVPPIATAHYVTAKYAMLGLMKALAFEFAGKHITINALSPSMVETRFLDELPEKLVELHAHQHPLQRNALPNDIAPLVKFLLSDQSAYMTGLNIPVTGGSVF